MSDITSTPADLTTSIRALTDLVQRAKFGRRFGNSYEGEREMAEALGYPVHLTLEDFLHAYTRGGLAKRVVDIFPRAVWGGGVEIVEDPDPKVETEFEVAARKLFKRLGVWDRLRRASVCSYLGEYGVLLIGAAGDLVTPLSGFSSPDDVLWLMPYLQLNAKISTLVNDPTDARFGLPLMYHVTTQAHGVRGGGHGAQGARSTFSSDVHWTRVIHVVAEPLTSDTLGIPILQAAWNDLLDALKVKGGGAEAFWRRADSGMHVDLPTSEGAQPIEVKPEDKDKLKDQVDELVHRLRRVLITEGGAKLNILSGDVADYAVNLRATLEQVAATIAVPIRILIGNTAGERATRDDRDTFFDRVRAIRMESAIPTVRQLVDRFIEFGALPAVEEYDAVWPLQDGLTALERSTVVRQYAQANRQQKQATGKIIIGEDEIRDTVLSFDTLEEAGVETSPGDGDSSGESGERNGGGNEQTD